MAKEVLLKEAAKVWETAKVKQWYTRHMEHRDQKETVNDLLEGVGRGYLTVREALYIAFIVGFQWNIKFEGTP